MNTTFKISALLGIVLITYPLFTIAYKIHLPGIHESFTTNALECLDSYNGSTPTDCITKIKACIDTNPTDKSHLKKCYTQAKATNIDDFYTNDELTYAVSWPDDPTREFSPSSIAKWGSKMQFTCQSIFENKKKLLIHEDGLLCSTHFGPMQFWHSQASSPNESASDTYEHIRDWIIFNYKVAIEEIKHDADYCDYFDEDKSTIANILKPEGYSFCEPRKYLGIFPTEKYWGWLGVAPYPAYDIATLYGLTCSDPFQSKTCEEEQINNLKARLHKTKLTAIGAILHVVHDSYAKGHVIRQSGCGSNVDDDNAISRIDCSAASMYTTYGYLDVNSKFVPQNDHSISDKWPDIDNNCSIIAGKQNDFYDPITASARILWHIKNSSDINIFLKDIDRIINNPGTDILSGLGQCYIK